MSERTDVSVADSSGAGADGRAAGGVGMLNRGSQRARQAESMLSHPARGFPAAGGSETSCPARRHRGRGRSEPRPG